MGVNAYSDVPQCKHSSLLHFLFSMIYNNIILITDYEQRKYCSTDNAATFLSLHLSLQRHSSISTSLRLLPSASSSSNPGRGIGSLYIIINILTILTHTTHQQCVEHSICTCYINMSSFSHTAYLFGVI